MAAELYSEKDLEKSTDLKSPIATETPDVAIGESDEIARTRRLHARFPVFRKLRESEEWLDSKVGVELQGIDRIADEDKEPPSIWNAFFFWWSLNIHVGVIPLGLLGPEFGLDFKQSIAAAIVGNILGALCTAFTSTMGPRLGLRTIACSRYSFGFWGAKLCSILNIVVGGGFYVINLVSVGQILNAVSGYSMSVVVGIVIISIVSYVLSIFGFKMIHTYEKYSWIVAFILMAVLVGQAAPHVDVNAPGSAGGIGGAGAFLSFLSVCFSNASGWCSISADYTVHYKKNTGFWKLFNLTLWGVVFPVTWSIIIGICLGNAAITAEYPPYADAYDAHNLGGLLLTAYHPLGFSKFCLVILAFSVLGNNAAIAYSSGLSLQLLGHYFHAVPRYIWSFIFAVVVAVIAIAGQSNVANVVNYFVSLLGYWTIAFTLVILLEDRIWRRRSKFDPIDPSSGYDLAAWDKPEKLPLGAAAVFSLLAAYLAGGVPGMAQHWYVGPVAAKFGEFGGDVGIYMAAAITLVCYPPLRALERHYMRR